MLVTLLVICLLQLVTKPALSSLTCQKKLVGTPRDIVKRVWQSSSRAGDQCASSTFTSNDKLSIRTGAQPADDEYQWFLLELKKPVHIAAIEFTPSNNPKEISNAQILFSAHFPDIEKHFNCNSKIKSINNHNLWHLCESTKIDIDSSKAFTVLCNSNFRQTSFSFVLVKKYMKHDKVSTCNSNSECLSFDDLQIYQYYDVNTVSPPKWTHMIYDMKPTLHCDLSDSDIVGCPVITLILCFSRDKSTTCSPKIFGTEVRMEDSGYYTCIVENTPSVSSSPIFIKVERKASSKIILPRINDYIVGKKTEKIILKSKDGIPSPDHANCTVFSSSAHSASILLTHLSNTSSIEKVTNVFEVNVDKSYDKGNITCTIFQGNNSLLSHTVSTLINVMYTSNIINITSSSDNILIENEQWIANTTQSFRYNLYDRSNPPPNKNVCHINCEVGKIVLRYKNSTQLPTVFQSHLWNFWPTAESKNCTISCQSVWLLKCEDEDVSLCTEYTHVIDTNSTFTPKTVAFKSSIFLIHNETFKHHKLRFDVFVSEGFPRPTVTCTVKFKIEEHVHITYKNLIDISAESSNYDQSINKTFTTTDYYKGFIKADINCEAIQSDNNKNYFSQTFSSSLLGLSVHKSVPTTSVLATSSTAPSFLVLIIIVLAIALAAIIVVIIVVKMNCRDRVGTYEPRCNFSTNTGLAIIETTTNSRKYSRPSVRSVPSSVIVDRTASFNSSSDDSSNIAINFDNQIYSKVQNNNLIQHEEEVYEDDAYDAYEN